MEELLQVCFVCMLELKPEQEKVRVLTANEGFQPIHKLCQDAWVNLNR